MSVNKIKINSSIKKFLMFRFPQPFTDEGQTALFKDPVRTAQ